MSGRRMDAWRSAEAMGSVASTVVLLQDLLISKGVTPFGTFDHGANARTAGLDLPDEVVLVFGSPATGTLLMQDSPDVGFDLPLRMLVRDDHGVTRVGYRDPIALIDAYGLTDSRPTVEKMSSLLADLLDRVARD